MEDESGKTCKNCGATVKEGASFCTQCGAATATAAGAAAATPPPAPPAPGAPEAKRGRAPLILGVIGGVLIVGAIVVLVLFIAFWSGNGGESGTGEPQALAQKYMNALENKDAAAYVDCIDAGFFENIGLTQTEAETMVEGYFMMLKVDFRDVELEVTEDSGDSVVVVTTAGNLMIGSLDYSEIIDLAGDPIYFYTIEEGGRWYLEDDPMDQVMGTDIGYEDGGEYDFNLEDFDMEDLDQLELDMEELERMLEDLDMEELERMLEDLDIEELREWLEQFEKGEVPIQV